jgi:hypothetical protein
MKTVVLDRQSLMDVAVQNTGDASAAFDVALANELSLTDSLNAGGALTFNVTKQKQIADYYENRQLKPATGMTEEQMNNTVGYGIEFMGIEIDFMA